MNDERQPLSPRRKNQSMELVFDGVRYQLTIGFYTNGRIGEVWLNGKKLDIPSFLVKPGMVVSITNRHVNNVEVVQNVERARMRAIPGWLELSPEKPEGKIVSLPSRAEIDTQVTEQLVVEFYSK